jgi:hypothetical protein
MILIRDTKHNGEGPVLRAAETGRALTVTLRP